MTRITQFTNLWLSLLLALAMTAPCSIRVQAESQSPSSQSFPTDPKAYQPGDVGTPGRREGGGTRGDCIKVPQDRTSNPQDRTSKEYQLIALIPSSTFGKTNAERPTLFVYVPETNPQAEAEMEFVLMTIDRKEIDKTKTRFKVTGNGGILRLSLSALGNLPPLETDKVYRWGLKLICYPDVPERDISQDQYVEGLIRREAIGEVQAATPRDRAVTYAKAKFWYDALTTLAGRLNSNDPKAMEDWTDLLRSVGLEKIAQEPLFQPVAGSERQNLPVSSDG